MDVVEQAAAQSADAEGQLVVAKRSFMNLMDPLYRFNFKNGVWELFKSATVLESMLVALEHMQVYFVTGRARMGKFHKNVISFAQDIPGFASRLGLLQGYRAGDRVDSVRGSGDDVGREPRTAAANPDLVDRLATDERGYLVFPAEVREVLSDGKLVLDYDFDMGRGVELPEFVSPRLRMPWHPRFLKGQTTIMLRRNLGRGRKLEGLEVRWGLVARCLRALSLIHISEPTRPY